MRRRSLISQLFLVNTIPEINVELNCTKTEAMAALAKHPRKISRKIVMTRYSDTKFRIEKKQGFYTNTSKTLLEGEIIERNGRALINAKYRYYTIVYLYVPILIGLLIASIIYAAFTGTQLYFMLSTLIAILTITSIITTIPLFLIFQGICLYFDRPRRETMYNELLKLKEALEK